MTLRSNCPSGKWLLELPTLGKRFGYRGWGLLFKARGGS
jgi:hypothetical protein